MTPQSKYAMVVFGVFAVMLLLMKIAAWYDGRYVLPRPCADFANLPAKDLPARCTKEYDPNR